MSVLNKLMMVRKITSCKVKLKIKGVSYSVDLGAKVVGRRLRTNENVCKQ
jgi:hypothetical protein